MEKIKVGILGCTGAVGQKLISLLEGHPYFVISEIAASENSAGRKYDERVSWRETKAIPENVKEMVIKECRAGLDARILFSGLDAKIAGDTETEMAKAGYIVISNSRNHRMDEDVPLMIPEINSDHFELTQIQKKRWGSGGFIVTNPNCSVVALAIALFPIYKKYGLKKVITMTMQSVSGAGYPGVPSMDIIGNVIPHIGGGEEEKIETEALKILGEINGGKIKNADFKVSAMCNRVPVINGHTLAVSVETEKKAGKEEIINSFGEVKVLNLPSSPSRVITYTEDEYRPQPILDAENDKGMTVTIGNLRKCSVLDWKFTVLGHNTIRGAAGAAILNGEWMAENGKI